MEKEKTIGYTRHSFRFSDCRSLTLKAIDFSYLYYPFYISFVLIYLLEFFFFFFLFFPVFWNYCVNRWVWIFLNGTHTIPTIVSVEQTILSRLSSRLGRGQDRLYLHLSSPFLFFEKKTTCVCIPIERKKEHTIGNAGCIFRSAIPRKCYISWEFFVRVLLHHFC